MPSYGYKPRRQYRAVEAGTHLAWLVHFIDLGTHEENGQYGLKENRLGRMLFAFPDLLMDDGRPMTLGHKLNLSPHEKANFRKICSNWLGRKFTDRGFIDWDEAELFNVPCLVTVSHKDGDDGTPYAVISNVMPIMKGMRPSPLPDDTTYIHLSLNPDKFSQAEYEKVGRLSERQVNEIYGKIEASPEWRELMNPSAPEETQQYDPDAYEPDEAAPAAEVDNDHLTGAAAWPEENEDPAPAPAPKPQPARQQAAPAQRPAPQQQRPAAPAQRQAPAAPQRQPAPAQRPAAPVQQQRAAQVRPSGPAPARPAPQPGSNSQRAIAGRPAAPQARPQQRPAVVDPDIGPDVPF